VIGDQFSVQPEEQTEKIEFSCFLLMAKSWENASASKKTGQGWVHDQRGGGAV
jgi:hypothetical protein